MILDSITIDGIRSYRHERIEFPGGTSLFEGDMGSGKSTILMSIEFALFGLGSQNAESLLAKRSESGYVMLEFSVGGEKYGIRRTLRRRNSAVSQDPKESWITIGGEKEPLSPSELKQRVLQILKFNEPADPKAESRIFRYAVFTPQEAMKEVLANPKKRPETIRRAFGIEEYSTAASNASELVREIGHRREILQERFKDIPGLESENREAAEAISGLESSIRETQLEKQGHELAVKDAAKELEGLREDRVEMTRIEGRKASAEERIGSAERRAADLRAETEALEAEVRGKSSSLEGLNAVEKPDTTKTIRELEEEIARFRKTEDGLIRLNAEKDGLEAEISAAEAPGGTAYGDRAGLERELDRLNAERSASAKFLDAWERKRGEAQEKQTRGRTRKGDLEEEIREFEQLGNACPTCKQEITEAHHHDLVGTKRGQIRGLEAEITEAAESLGEAGSRLEEIRSEMESRDSRIAHVQESIRRIGELESKKAKLGGVVARISGLEAESAGGKYGDDPLARLTETRDGLVEYEHAKERMDMVADAIRRAEGRIEENKRAEEEQARLASENRDELKALLSQLDGFGGLDERMAEKEALLEASREEATDAERRLARQTERKSQEEKRVAANNERIVASRRWKERFDEITECGEWLERFFIPTTKSIEKQVLLNILQNFNETYRRWYSILVDDPNKESRIDEDFAPTVEQDGFEQQVEYMSGGEKTSVALAYRLTLNSLIRKETDSMKSNLLILDEPTDGFSKGQLERMREVLEDLESEQIVLVSHEKELETYVDHVFRVTKQDGVSRVSAGPG